MVAYYILCNGRISYSGRLVGYSGPPSFSHCGPVQYRHYFFKPALQCEGIKCIEKMSFGKLFARQLGLWLFKVPIDEV